VKNRYYVDTFLEGDYFEREVKYAVYHYVENTFKHIHTNEDLCNLVVVCNTRLIAEKICELLNVDNYIEENK
jgi:hypothetical protein